MSDDNRTDDEFPGYLRPRFLVVVVVLAVGAGFLLQVWGSPDPVPLRTTDTPATPSTVVNDDVPAEPAPAGATDDCPDAAAVNFDAAVVIGEFLEGVATPEAPTVPASEEIQAIVDDAAPGPAVQRMTRIGGFSSSGSSVFTCVESIESDSTGVTRTVDLVRVDAVNDEWIVTEWARGARRPQGDVSAATVAFFDNDRTCRSPDREVSVRIPVASPSDRLRRAVEEVVSGPTGLAPGAGTQIPPDVQVVEASVEGSTARVVLTPTSEDITRCSGTGAAEQIIATARAVLASLGAEVADEGAVELVINGEVVDSLRN